MALSSECNPIQSNRTELGTISMWEGEKLQGKRLLVYLEQGLGDGIFALRYLPSPIEQGAILKIVARPALLPLIHITFPQIKTHNEEEVSVVGYWDKISSLPDFWVYGLSIPFRAGLWHPTQASKFLKASQPLIKNFSLLAASVIMFICMALGEIFYDENIFSGLLRRPQIWLGIFIETSMATLLMTTIGALVLYRFRFLEKKSSPKFRLQPGVFWVRC